jgi:hypothetical protein
LKLVLKSFPLVWLTIWLVSTTIVLAPQIGTPSDLVPIGSYFIAAFYAVSFFVVPWLITLGCTAKQWFAWIIVTLILILPLVAIYNSDHVATTYSWKERAGAVASDGWVSTTTGSGAASHHGEVRE